jgi:adenine-specific DNA-methyltransferase
MIKYLGSKRRLVPILADLYSNSGCNRVLDLFTGTTRVAQAFKKRGAHVTAVDSARYSEVFGNCWISLCESEINRRDLRDALAYLMSLPGEPGYFTETFCIESRFFQPHNGSRIDQIRNVIEAEYRDSALYYPLLTSLILAADRVDSTTAVQMAFLKQWSARSHNSLELREPTLLNGRGTTIRADATSVSRTLGSFDLAYLDPPYNQHRYFTNYHIYETLVAWDSPEHYGVACKRIDCRDSSTKSVFNQKRKMPEALCETISNLDCECLLLSYNNESWLTLNELLGMCSHYERVKALGFDSKRYVGAKIGIYAPSGAKVGKISHLRNVEYLVVAGPADRVERMTRGYESHEPAAALSEHTRVGYEQEPLFVA